MSDDPPARREKASYVGAPAIFALAQACHDLWGAFCNDGGGLYMVGSALERPDWRDVDLRLILPDDEFVALFPKVPLHSAGWEHDPRWLMLTVAISERLSKVSGLPVDFQFQPSTFANEKHRGIRNPIGLRLSDPA